MYRVNKLVNEAVRYIQISGSQSFSGFGIADNGIRTCTIFFRFIHFYTSFFYTLSAFFKIIKVYSPTKY